MKKTNTFYWIFTGLLAAMMLLSSIPDIMNIPEAKDIVVKHLGYPAYFTQYIGVAKLLGVIAILVPGFPRIREWAYAGFVFDIISATYSSISVGDPVSKWAFMPVFIIIIALSYIFYHKKLKGDALKNVA